MTCGEFENGVRQALDRMGIEKKSRVGVAFSGGADSVCLLLVMQTLGYDVTALHCDFSLRGEESDRDREFCKNLCAAHGIPVEVVKFDTRAQRLQGESVEMTCRRLRYDWFAAICRKLNLKTLLTGHHSDDNAETLFLNLFRGTGLRGIAGIPPASNRRKSPMLDFSRKDILEYLGNRGAGFITDSSNLENDYSRNRIRNIILPEICREFPDAPKGIATTIANLRDAGTLLDALVEQKRAAYMSGHTLRLHDLLAAEPFADTLLYYILAPYGFTRIVTDEIAAATESGKQFCSTSGFTASVSRGNLVIIRQDSEPEYPEIIIEKTTPDKILRFASDHRTLYLDADKVGENPDFIVRGWKTGDRIAPFGMKGKTRLVSDIFSDAGVPVTLRTKIPLLTLNDEILWVYGCKETDTYRVTPRTEHILIVRFTTP